MIESMAKPRSSKKGTSEGPDLFAFAAVRGDEPCLSVPSSVRPAAQAEATDFDNPAAIAGQLLACLESLPDSDLLGLVSVLSAEVARRGLTPARAMDEPAPKSGGRQMPSSSSSAKPGSSLLPTSKVNAIRAALEAGVKPGAVARQFGVSIAQIKKIFDQG